jgi:hypothetical protein
MKPKIDRRALEVEEEWIKAELREAVIEAAKQGLRGRSRAWPPRSASSKGRSWPAPSGMAATPS